MYEGMTSHHNLRQRPRGETPRAQADEQLPRERKEDAIKITPPIECTLEYGVEFIEDDELVEITPKSIRLRKRHLKEHDRKRASREG